LWGSSYRTTHAWHPISRGKRPGNGLALRYRTHICDLLNRRLPSDLLMRKPSYRVSPMTEGKVLVIVLACYGVLLLAMVYFFPEQVMP
jgi:hypothetical protein